MPRWSSFTARENRPETAALAERFARDGIAALVYDKRGAGKSGGDYEGNQNVSEKNISLLADDAVSALQRLAAHTALKGIPVGFAGISQAGWIAPLAAERSELAKFLVLWSGPVCKVSEEDIFSKYTSDADGQIAPSYDEALKSRTEKYVWPDFLGRDTDSGESLEKLSIAGLWIFSDNDPSIPVDLSLTSCGNCDEAGIVTTTSSSRVSGTTISIGRFPSSPIGSGDRRSNQLIADRLHALHDLQQFVDAGLVAALDNKDVNALLHDSGWHRLVVVFEYEPVR